MFADKVRRPKHGDPAIERKLARVLKFLSQGLMSKARGLILSSGLGDMDDPDVVAQLDAKHPLRKRAMPGSFPSDEATCPLVTVDEEALRKQYRGLERLAGTGPDGMRNEYLIALAAKFEPGSPASEAIGHRALSGASAVWAKT